MKAIEQYFQLVLFIILYKVVPILKPQDETLVCDDHSTKSNCAVLSSGTAVLLCCVYVARPDLTLDTWCQKASDCFFDIEQKTLNNFEF